MHMHAKDDPYQQILKHNRELLVEAIDSMEAAGVILSPALQTWKEIHLEMAELERKMTIEELQRDLHGMEMVASTSAHDVEVIKGKLKSLGWEG